MEQRNPSNKSVRLLRLVFMLALATSLLAELFIDHHAYFGIDGWRFFNAGFGFLACAVIIVFSKIVGVFLKRPPLYYEEKHHGK